MQVYLIGVFLFVIALVVFIYQNTSMVTVQFLNWVSPGVPLAVVALIAAGVGAIVTLLVASIRYIKFAKRIKELTDINKKLHKEIKSLQSDKATQLKKEETEKISPEA